MSLVNEAQPEGEPEIGRLELPQGCPKPGREVSLPAIHAAATGPLPERPLGAPAHYDGAVVRCCQGV